MKHQSEFPVSMMCRALKVSRSGFYDWMSRPEAARSAENQHLTSVVREIFERSDSTYGAPRVARALRKRGYHCSKNRAARLMRKEGLCSVHRRRFRVTTTDSNHNEPIAENLLAQDFSASRVGEKVGCDITYLQTDEGWLYLAVVLDFYSRKILGYAFSDRIDSGIVCKALIGAVGNHRLPSELLHHSDRGAQYASARYRALLKSLGIVQSMSRTGNCYDNAMTESFFHTLKVERVHRRRYRTKAIAAADVAQYIEEWYHPERIHSSLGMIAPDEFVAQQKLVA